MRASLATNGSSTIRIRALEDEHELLKPNKTPGRKSTWLSLYRASRPLSAGATRASRDPVFLKGLRVSTRICPYARLALPALWLLGLFLAKKV
jgi:hypothetical protein